MICFACARTRKRADNIPQTTRGIHSDFIIVDEMAFIPVKLLKETILPILGKAKTCLIGISTPTGTDNVLTWVMNIMDKTHKPPRPVFNVVKAAKVCDACVAAGNEMYCTHMVASIPPWKNIGKVQRMAALYENDPHLHMRENLGIVADSGDKAFDGNLLTAFLGRLLPRQADAPRCIFVSADPTGGGKSQLAVVATFDRAGSGVLSVCLIAAAAGMSGLPDEKAFMRDIWSRLRSRYGSNTPIVFMPEGLPSKEGSHLREYIRDDPFTLTMQECGNWHGVPKTNDTTKAMRTLMEINLLNATIAFEADMVGIPTVADRKTAGGPGTPTAAVFMRNQVVDQLRAYRWEPTQSSLRSDFEKTVMKLTGKRGGTEQDDLAIAMLMNALWKRRFYESYKAEYVNFRKNFVRPGGGMLA